MSANPLIDPALLFEFSIQIYPFIARSTSSTRRATRGKSKIPPADEQVAWELSEHHRLPHFATLNGKPPHSSVYVAWSDAGLYFQMISQGKRKPPAFVQERGGVSDGLRVWIDTRGSAGVHRATRFCHCFHFFPGSLRPQLPSENPRGILDEIPRSREQPSAIDPNDLQVRSSFQTSSYQLWAFVPQSCLTGYSPREFDRIRLTCDVVDAERGTQSMVLGPELRYAEDPSLWVEARLVESTPPPNQKRSG